MTGPTAVARASVDRTDLRGTQLDALQALLEESLAEWRHQHDHNEALLQAIFDAAENETGNDGELTRAAAERARDAIDEIEGALRRLADGTYGTCGSCGRPIPFERLEAIPQARYCVACPRPGGASR